MGQITKQELIKGYIRENKSAFELSKRYKCSENKINYWLKKYKIPKRSISEAIYKKNNPDGDPFKEIKLQRKEDYFMMGLGLGLYWGEGTKSNKYSVRMGNTDASLLNAFIKYLDVCFSIKKEDLHFGLQIFHDIDKLSAERYWRTRLSIKKEQFYKTILSPSQSTGTYKKKSRYGVLTLHFNNKKMRNVLCNKIEELQKMY